MEDSNEIFNHETTSKLEYMEAAIEENLRMYPPVTMMDRLCVKDIKIGDIHFKKGVNIGT